MKKIIYLAVLCLIVVCTFSACTNNSNNSQNTEKSSKTQSESALTTEPTGRIYYDKYGNEYEALEQMPFYDENDNKYYLTNQTQQIFTNEKGNAIDGNQCFVDTHGVFVNDKDGKITLIDSLSAKDENGKMYYPASTVRWTVDGAMINAFGLGKEVVPD